MSDKLTFLNQYFLIGVFISGLLVIVATTLRKWNAQGEMNRYSAKEIVQIIFKRVGILILAILLSIPVFAVALYIVFDMPLKELPKAVIQITEHISDGKFKSFKKELWLCLAWAFLPIFLAFAYFLKPPKATQYGKAKWGKKSDVLKMGLNFNDGFTLAKAFGKEIKYNAPLSCLVVAPPGTGKTSAIAIPNLLNIKESFIVTDVKGELCALTSEYRKNVLKNKILIFNPFGSDNNFCFNPFAKRTMEKLGIAEQMALVKEVANIIFIKESSHDDHWRQQAISLFVFFTMYYVSKNGEATLFEIHRAPKKDWSEELNEDSIIEIAEKKALTGEDTNILKAFLKEAGDDKNLDMIIRDYARQFFATPANEFGSILSTFARFTNLFGDYRIQKVTDTMSFDYEDLRKENITVYLKTLEKDIPVLSPLIRIIIDSIAKNLMVRESKAPNERVYMLMDEFVRFGKLEFLLELPAISRSYNIAVIFITQSYALIKKHYSEDDVKILSETIAYQVVFRMNNANSAEEVAKEIGDYTARKTSESTQGTKFFGSVSTSEEARKLLSAQDILNIPSDKVIILTTGHKAKPILATANFYFKDSSMSNKIKKFSKKD
ncbi:MAG: type IV secretory system conjugative DNA transfer family protein [Campylobacteraceae bacterium]|jgi:type IV secretion system protein VirD4|nr:type IV secretory system conjugative DNA transfer family protein [Campylobacteraceae bacterium]